MPALGTLILVLLFIGWAIFETIVIRETWKDAMRRLGVVLVIAAYVILLALIS